MQIFEDFIAANGKKQASFLQKKFKAPAFIPLFEYKENYKSSHGGVRITKKITPVVLISDSYLTKQYRAGEYKIKFTEYYFIKNRGDIGSFTGTWQQYLTATLSHELAHAFVLWNVATQKVIEVPAFFKPSMPPPGDYHMADWQYVYALLRKQFLDPTFKASKELEQLFQID